MVTNVDSIIILKSFLEEEDNSTGKSDFTGVLSFQNGRPSFMHVLSYSCLPILHFLVHVMVFYRADCAFSMRPLSHRHKT